ncbi:hypothetical protein A0R60_0411 [Enterobacter asburiae]|nr:hypothetical protein A0R60_0411 [Enterobacter asburiae]
MSNTHLHNDVFYPHRTNIISELVNGKRVPGPIWRKREYRLKFLLRSLLFWSSTHRMLDAFRVATISTGCWPLKLRCPARPTDNI